MQDGNKVASSTPRAFQAECSCVCTASLQGLRLPPTVSTRQVKEQLQVVWRRKCSSSSVCSLCAAQRSAGSPSRVEPLQRQAADDSAQMDGLWFYGEQKRPSFCHSSTAWRFLISSPTEEDLEGSRAAKRLRDIN